MIAVLCAVAIVVLATVGGLPWWVFVLAGLLAAIGLWVEVNA